MARQDSNRPGLRESYAPPAADRVASMWHVERLIRARLRRRSEEGHRGINIYPMMDMMTILLVFMVMQFASSTAAVVQESSELRLPLSTSSVDLGDALPVQISKSQVIVDGKPLLALSNGVVDSADKQGGSTGFLITALYKEASRVRDMRKAIAQQNARRPFTGEVQIIADRDTPYRTLSEVVYTLGQAEFANLRFVSNKVRSE